MSMVGNIWFVYDGECPLCQTVATFYKLKQSVEQLHVIDARSQKQHPLMDEINKAGLDLDEGMVIKYQNRLYQGNDALHLMAELGADTGIFNKTNKSVFKSRKRADAIYPWLKMLRNIALKLKGIGKIDNLKK